MERLKNKLLSSKLLRLLGLVIFVLILMRLNVQQILTQFIEMRLGILLVAVVILVIFHALKAIRWQYILSLQGKHYSFIESYLVYLSGLFVGILTPGRIGDFVKILYLKADGFSTIKATFSSFLDRILDLLFLFICGLFVLPWINHLLPINPHFLWVFFLTFISAIFVYKFLGLDRFRSLALKLVPKSYVPVFDRGMDEIKANLKSYNFWKIFTLIVLTVVGWLIYFLVIYTLTRSIGLSIPFVYVVTFFIISTIITFVPISMAGIGTRDLALLLMFSQIGYQKEEAISFSLLILVSYFFTALFGFIAWLFRPIKV